MLFLSAIWFAAPAIVGGAFHIAAIKHNVWPALARPLDGGARIRGRRLFGDNKTVRGVVLMVLFTTVAAVAQAWIAPRFPSTRALALPGTEAIPAVTWGVLLGLGYVLGELPNSFLKRQLDIAPGQAGRGWTAPVFWVLDQIDSLIGAVIAMSFVWVPPIEIVVALLIITLTVHPLAAASMVALGLKDRVG